MSKPIRLTAHAVGYITKRGFVIEEFVDSIQTIQWVSTDLGRLQCTKNFEFKNNWNQKYYSIKQVPQLARVCRRAIKLSERVRLTQSSTTHALE
ncbi:MAG: hypothetical protein LH473_02665 [Chitinophagales bacterium]|nr:hypothetical protein [Chitinophagales bacterium]